MRKHIFKTVTGICPAVNDKLTIELEYSEISTRSTKETYKAVSLKCEKLDQCTEGYCPIMKEHITLEL